MTEEVQNNDVEEVEIDSFDDDSEGDIDTFEDPTITQTEAIGDSDGKDDDSEDEDGEDAEKSEDEKEDDSDDDEEEGDSSDDSEDKKQSDNDSYTVKVDGEEVEVSLQELKNSFSGHKAVEKRFNEFNREKRRAEREITKSREELDSVKNDLSKHLNTITSIMDDPRVNPLEALYYLVDLKGGNTVEYEKKMMNSLQDIFNSFGEMDEVEQELYWTKKEKDFLTRRRESNFSKSENEQANRNSQAQLEKTWEANEISEDDYYDARDELVELGYKADEMKPEQIVNFIKLKPIYDQANQITSPFADDLGDSYDDFVDGMAKAIQSFPQAGEEDLIRLVAKNMGIEVESDDEELEELQHKLPRKSLTNRKPRKKVEIDTW